MFQSENDYKGLSYRFNFYPMFSFDSMIQIKNVRLKLLSLAFHYCDSGWEETYSQKKLTSL